MELQKAGGTKRTMAADESREQKIFKQLEELRQRHFVKYTENDTAGSRQNLFQELVDRAKKSGLLETTVSESSSNNYPETLENDYTSENADLFVQEDEKVTLEEVQTLANSLPVKGNREMNCEVIKQFVQLVLQTLESKMNDRSEEESSINGKLESFMIVNVRKRQLKPLMKQLKEFSLPEAVLDNLLKIVLACLERDYEKADEAYLVIVEAHPLRPIEPIDIARIYDLIKGRNTYDRTTPIEKTPEIRTIVFKMLIKLCKRYCITDPAMCVTQQEPSQTKPN